MTSIALLFVLECLLLFSALFSIVTSLLWEERELVYVLSWICLFIRDWLRLVIVALPGLLYFFFFFFLHQALYIYFESRFYFMAQSQILLSKPNRVCAGGGEGAGRGELAKYVVAFKCLI